MDRRGFLKTLGACVGAALAPIKFVVSPINRVIPFNWSRPLPNHELIMLKALLANGIVAHDDLIEQYIFRSSLYEVGGPNGVVYTG